MPTFQSSGGFHILDEQGCWDAPDFNEAGLKALFLRIWRSAVTVEATPRYNRLKACENHGCGDHYTVSNRSQLALRFLFAAEIGSALLASMKSSTSGRMFLRQLLPAKMP